MPLIYSATCPACGHEDGTPDQSLQLQLDDGSLTPLPHPAESHYLEAAGYTWDRAQDEARLIHTTTRLCRACGRFADIPRRLTPRGCLANLLLLATLAAVAILVKTAPRLAAHDRSPWVLLGSAVIALLAWIIVRRLETRAFRANLPNRAPLPTTPCCPIPRLRRLPMISLRKYPCPTCRQRTLTVRCTAIS